MTALRAWLERLGANLALLGVAMVAPKAAWQRVLPVRVEANWVYLFVAFESLFMRPEQSARAVWSIERRGATSFVVLARLMSLQVITVLVGTYVAALLVKLLFLRRPKPLDMGLYAALLPWAYAPKLIVTAMFSVAWALKLLPSQTMTYDALLARQPEALAYLGLSAAALGWSFWHFAKQHALLEATPEVAQPAQTRLRAALLPLLLVLVVGAAVTARVVGEPRMFRPFGRGDGVKALSFAALAADAPALRLSFPRERPVVIDFWATWCGPCVEALPEWQRLAAQADTLGADFVSANTEQETPNDVRNFLRERGYTFPVHTADASLSAGFQVNTLPTLIVLSTRGEVVEYWVGGASERAIRSALDRAR